jgi:hypothetical protein
MGNSDRPVSRHKPDGRTKMVGRRSAQPVLSPEEETHGLYQTKLFVHDLLVRVDSIEQTLRSSVLNIDKNLGIMAAHSSHNDGMLAHDRLLARVDRMEKSMRQTEATVLVLTKESLVPKP